MDVTQAAEEIRSMRVRGAGKIGRYAAGTLGGLADAWDGRMDALEDAARTLVAARPTAVTLPNAVEFVMRRVRRAPEGDRVRALREAADEFERRAAGAIDEVARRGAALIPEGATLLTLCHSQGALRPMIEAARQGKEFSVIALETRPWRQGLLSVKQLNEAGLPDVSLAIDSSAWTLLREVDLVLCGADTVTRNGDVINKVGTGGVAVLARERGVPMYSCFETFKLAPHWETGEDVPIEERETTEVVKAGEVPDGVRIRNPVFDVTPGALLEGYVTELGVLASDELVPAARKAWEWP